MEENFELIGDEVEILLEQSGLTIWAPSLMGSGVCKDAEEVGYVRSAADELSLWDEAIAESEFQDRHTLVIEAETPVNLESRQVRGGADVGDMQIKVPLGENEMAILLYADEAGGLSFHQALSVENLPAARVGARATAAEATFDLHLRRPAGSDDDKTRGFFSKLGAKVIKILVTFVAPDSVGSIGEKAVTKWEDENRSFEGLYSENPAYWSEEPSSWFEDFDQIKDRRSLLFIHGTFSTNARTFAGLTENGDFLDRLIEAYDGRILGFNHKTLSSGIARNVELFYEQFEAQPGDYEFDVICHSRGGLVARAIMNLTDEDVSQALGKDWQRPTGVNIEFRRIVFVATPNEGTILASEDGVPAYADRLANYINMLPDGFFTVSASAVLALATSVLDVTFPRIQGLVDQVPGSDLLSKLNANPLPANKVFAITSNFEPGGDLKNILADLASDQIFQGQTNDLVVPTDGVHTPFDIGPDNLLVFASAARIHHGNFFDADEMVRLIDWLN